MTSTGWGFGACVSNCTYPAQEFGGIVSNCTSSPSHRNRDQRVQLAGAPGPA